MLPQQPPQPPRPPRDFNRTQLAMIRRTIARNCSDAEFDEFIAVALLSGLDPLRRQITPLIVNANDPERRQLLPWATIDGLRVIAARQGDYRAMDRAPIFERDEARVDPDRNPLGLVRAEVWAWKRSDQRWHTIAGEAWWDEYVPIRHETGNRGAPRLVLDHSWARMGRLMLAKCAEAQALRRGWPDILSGLYSEEELHAVRLHEQTASEILRQYELAAQRTSNASAHALWFEFEAGSGLQAIDRRDVAAHLRDYYAAAPSGAAIVEFHQRNQQSLQIFWDWAPDEALELKKIAEGRIDPPPAAASSARNTRAPSKRRAQRKKREAAIKRNSPPVML